MQDDESGLIYMRARYYEPSSGRFVSEDPARDGRNWQTYCGSEPVNRKDFTGKFIDILLAGAIDGLQDHSDAAVSQAAKTWGEQKLKHIMSYYSGKIAGWLAAAAVEELIMGPTKLGFFISNPSNGKTIHIKMIGQDSGQISFQSSDGSTPYGYFKDALNGFTNGLNDGLGL